MNVNANRNGGLCYFMCNKVKLMILQVWIAILGNVCLVFTIANLGFALLSCPSIFHYTFLLIQDESFLVSY